jgi:glycosyltransferase involved in cell wall biosynthesis
MITVIVPARNEQSVIVRTLRAITEGATPGELDVIVVCNGCTDDTAAVAAAFGPPVRVVETTVASKTYALNLGDQVARGYPRIYADADIVITIDVIRALANRLQDGDVLAAAPTAHIDVTGCSWLVRAFFDIRSCLPSSSEGIGGSGVYALSESGRLRLGRFPELTADDGYVRIHFEATERATLSKWHSTVFAPRTIADLLRTKTRAHFGSLQLATLLPDLWANRGKGNAHAVIRLFTNPLAWPKVVVYVVVTLMAKQQARARFRRRFVGWERDESSRAAI